MLIKHINRQGSCPKLQSVILEQTHCYFWGKSVSYTCPPTPSPGLCICQQRAPLHSPHKNTDQPQPLTTQNVTRVWGKISANTSHFFLATLNFTSWSVTPQRCFAYNFAILCLHCSKVPKCQVFFTSCKHSFLQQVSDAVLPGEREPASVHATLPSKLCRGSWPLSEPHCTRPSKEQLPTRSIDWIFYHPTHTLILQAYSPVKSQQLNSRVLLRLFPGEKTQALESDNPKLLSHFCHWFNYVASPSPSPPQCPHLGVRINNAYLTEFCEAKKTICVKFLVYIRHSMKRSCCEILLLFFPLTSKHKSQLRSSTRH